MQLPRRPLSLRKTHVSVATTQQPCLCPPQLQTGVLQGPWPLTCHARLRYSQLQPGHSQLDQRALYIIDYFSSYSPIKFLNPKGIIIYLLGLENKKQGDHLVPASAVIQGPRAKILDEQRRSSTKISPTRVKSAFISYFLGRALFRWSDHQN